jgi:hypothetical protein
MMEVFLESKRSAKKTSFARRADRSPELTASSLFIVLVAGAQTEPQGLPGW